MLYRFLPGRSWFHCLDPLSKFVWLVSVSALCLRYETAAMQAVLLAAVVCFGRVLAGLPLLSMWRGIRLPFWFGVPYFFLQLFFLPGETPFVAVGPITVTWEALDFAAAVSMRLLTLFLASLLFIATTDPRDVVLALAQHARVPYRFAFGISIALRFLPILEEEAALVRSAQRLRGYGAFEGSGSRFGSRFGSWSSSWFGSWRRRLAEQRRFAFAIFANAVRRVQHIAETMEGRAFGRHPERTYRRTLVISRSGKAFAAVCLAGMAAAILIR
jgi:energy-coupling factor transport system permease protein